MDKEKIEHIVNNYKSRTNRLVLLSNINLVVIFVIVGVTIMFLYKTAETMIEVGNDNSCVISLLLIMIMSAYLVHIMYKTYRYNYLLADYYRELAVILTLYIHADIPFSNLIELYKYSKFDIGGSIGIGELISPIVKKY